jgi:hypothetical protein
MKALASAQHSPEDRAQRGDVDLWSRDLGRQRLPRASPSRGNRCRGRARPIRSTLRAFSAAWCISSEACASSLSTAFTVSLASHELSVE